MPYVHYLYIANKQNRLQSLQHYFGKVLVSEKAFSSYWGVGPYL